MKKFSSAALLVVISGFGLGACSGGNGTPFCNQSRDLVKALGAHTTITVADGTLATAAYHKMASNIPKDLTGVTKKDLDDLALVLQASYVDKNPASVVGKVDIARLKATEASVREYNIKHCDIVYKTK